MGHGSGGKMMNDLIQHLFAAQFSNQWLDQMGDAAELALAVGEGEPLRLAFTTDSYVVSPLIFPGGDIGELAVNGTVNDLAMRGARPAFLSAGFILVAGDTKVVNHGHGDGLYINTSGIGLIPPGVDVAPQRARPGDAILLSGPVGEHGVAILSVREGIEFETAIESDTAPLHELVSAMLAAAPELHCLRDATRGGLAAVLNELAAASRTGFEFVERLVPIRPAVQAACEMLGLDPYYVANEGKLVAVVPAAKAEAVLEAMHSHPYGREAVQIGRVVEDHPGLVIARTGIGGSRVVDLPAGELLPRIC
jgi:hydrogenase expression/formation protein HypE